MGRRYMVTQETLEGTCDLCGAFGAGDKKQWVVKVISLANNKRQCRCAGHVEELDAKMAEKLRGM